ncbi:MAG: molybdopterin dinucleotide binding domain-containing protein, partial [Acidimicrobiia bacterium]|nr:molybdopterin dinucleotide binding domain-containing protein [Acidimicrobiia bacterium]
MLDRLDSLADTPDRLTSDAYPFVLAAGERRSFTANTIFRDPDWRKRDREGALRMSPADADRLAIEDGDRVRVVTQRGSVEAVVTVSDTMRDGHISLPNGLGVDYPDDAGGSTTAGAATNELTWSELRDDFAGTPWHKHVPARVEVPS